MTPYDKTTVAALLDLVGGHDERRPRLSLLAIASDPVARAVAADPDIVDRLLTGNLGPRMTRGLFGSLWENGGAHVVESLRRLPPSPRSPGGGLVDPTVSVWDADRKLLADLASRGGTLRTHHPGPDARARRSAFSGTAVGSWEAIAYDSGIRPRGGETTGRLIIRRDVLEFLITELGFPEEIPSHIELREIPTDD